MPYPEWMDEDSIAEYKRGLGPCQPKVVCRTLRGVRATNLAALQDYTQAHAYAKRIDGDFQGRGFKSGEMRHARR
jgi:hypothetical protein